MPSNTESENSAFDWHQLPFARQQLEAYLATLYGNSIALHEVRTLKELGGGQLKAFGYGNPLFIEFSHITRKGERGTEQVVLHTMAPARFGHERRADRAYNLLLEYDTFNKLPRHVRSADVGAVTTTGALLSLGTADEFFHLSKFEPGSLYAEDLQRIADTGKLLPQDLARTEALAAYLAEIHGQAPHDNGLTPQLYRRTWRDLVGHGEGIMGMLDSYPADFAVAPPARLRAIEHQCIDWRWRCAMRTHRLRQVHGDFHPWNVLFQDGVNFVLLDRSRGEWGDPADDVSALSINYLLFGLRQQGKWAGPFVELFTRFWQHYLAQSGDDEVLDVIAPFFAWRALVVAHPIWYPSLDEPVRAAIFRFIEAVLAVDRFDPTQIDRYLE